MQGGIPAQPFLRQCTTWKGESSLLWGTCWVSFSMALALLLLPGLCFNAVALLRAAWDANTA